MTIVTENGYLYIFMYCAIVYNNMFAMFKINAEKVVI